MISEIGVVPYLLQQRHLGYAQGHVGSGWSPREGQGDKDESRQSQKTQCILVISKLEKCQELETPLDRANFRT